MLFGGNSGSCGGCGCKSCQQCTRTCTNPHTGTAFETVYTLYSGIVGAEIGNPTDGYLTATGDSDTDDPQDGMDGTGPWYQQIEGTFTLSPTTTRHPCRVDISFWRSNYQLGALSPGQPAPAETLTMNRVTIANQLGSNPVSLGGEVLEPGQTKTYDNIIPKVAGTGDQSLGDPRSPNGTVSFLAACANDTVTVVVKARLEWNVKQRQHIVYGTVRECYNTDPTDGCSGCPSSIYLTLSNITLSNVTPSSGASTQDLANSILNEFEGVLVLQRDFWWNCWWYSSYFQSSSSDVKGLVSVAVLDAVDHATKRIGIGWYWNGVGIFHGGGDVIQTDSICNAGYSKSGSFSGVSNAVSDGGLTFDMSFDWDITR